MVQRGEDFRFTLKPRKTIDIACHLVRQHLDGDRTFEVGVSGVVDLAHPAHTDLRAYLIGPDARPALQRHCLGILRHGDLGP